MYICSFLYLNESSDFTCFLKLCFNSSLFWVFANWHSYVIENSFLFSFYNRMLYLFLMCNIYISFQDSKKKVFKYLLYRGAWGLKPLQSQIPSEILWISPHMPLISWVIIFASQTESSSAPSYIEKPLSCELFGKPLPSLPTPVWIR